MTFHSTAKIQFTIYYNELIKKICAQNLFNLVLVLPRARFLGYFKSFEQLIALSKVYFDEKKTFWQDG